MKMLRPVVGSWYKDRQTGAIFEVVTWDTDELTIEAQYLDGEITEYHLDSWRELELSAVAEPEDWRLAYELDDPDSLDPDAPFRPTDWSNPVNTIEADHSFSMEEN